MLASSNHAGHAVVIGGSIAGLLTARILTNHFARVTVIERDQLPETPTFRMGAPHARHAHGLLVRGQQIMEEYFPGLVEELHAQGALSANMGSEVLLVIAGMRVNSFDSALEGIATSRPLLENVLYRRVRALPQVQFLDSRDVVGLRIAATGRRATGIRIRERGDSTHSIQELDADLVVDASGRSSRAPEWLQELGYAAPQEITVDAQAGYATRIYRRTDMPASWKVIYSIPQAPDQSRGCILVPMEGDRWVATLTGLNGDHPPTDEAGFMAFAKSVPVPEFYATIAQAEPLTEPYGYRKGANRLRRYDKLPRHLEGFLALGDAVYALNPVYGQGMTVAALGALTLDESLQSAAGHGGVRQLGFAQRFFKKLAKVNVGPWQLATGQDMRWPVAAAGHKTDPLTKLMQGYFDRVLLAMIDNSEVAEAFNHVQNMLKPPTTLFHPRIVWQVLRSKQGTSPAFAPSAQAELAHTA